MKLPPALSGLASHHAMRLLSFLTDVERAIRLEANASEDAIWDSARIVNFKTGLGRLTLSLRERDSGMPEGSVLVQYFGLANGSFCLKANLNWEGSPATSLLAVYDTPLLNWKLEASRVASAWLAGPPAADADSPSSPVAEQEPVAALG
mgnify:CR=1 FL=1|jgi:hypothetical protein